MDFPISATSGRMGRPPLNLTPRLIRLSATAVEKIEALVGKNRMSQFVREAVDREIQRREQAESSPKEEK